MPGKKEPPHRNRCRLFDPDSDPAPDIWPNRNVFPTMAIAFFGKMFRLLYQGCYYPIMGPFAIDQLNASWTEPPLRGGIRHYH